MTNDDWTTMRVLYQFSIRGKLSFAHPCLSRVELEAFLRLLCIYHTTSTDKRIIALVPSSYLSTIAVSYNTVEGLNLVSR